MKYIKVKIQSIENGDFQITDFVTECAVMLEVILNSNVFEKEFQELEMSSTRGMTNAKLFDYLKESAETANGDIDYEIDLNIFFFERAGNIGGMANEEKNIVRLNKWNMSRDNFEGVCGTIIHEHLHNLGFNHVSSLDHESVPYAVGFLVEKLLRKYGDKIKKSGIQRGKRLTIKRPWYFLWLIEIVKWK